MKRILLAALTVGTVATVALVASNAYFSDTEQSLDNTFVAGSLDLKVDSKCHYYHLVGFELEQPLYRDLGCGEFDPDGPTGNLPPMAVGSWEESDLGLHKFFWFNDIKPGDRGEDTISLHVYDNDAWGRFRVSDIQDLDNTCTEPEDEDANELCTVAVPEGAGAGLGELAENMVFSAWLDQGSIPGFQCVNAEGVRNPDCEDKEEGDNILQGGVEGPEILIWDGVPVAGGEWRISDILSSAYIQYCTQAVNPLPSPDGHNNYGVCHGLARDGRMVGSTTYYFGLAWSLPNTVGNIVQTDSLSADMSFDVVQHRNNPNGNF